MIDRQARDTFSELLRHLTAGLITNDEFEDRLPWRTKDAAIHRIFRSGAWLLYDDLREYRLTGKDRLSEKQKHSIAIWILFLKTNNEYRYPRILRMLDYFYPLLIVLSLSLSIPLLRHVYAKYCDPDIWPFSTKADYERSLAHGEANDTTA